MSDIFDLRPQEQIEFTITIFDKDGGPLTKRISLKANGTLHKDGSACVMVRGRARRVSFTNLGAFADCIGALSTTQAIALGALRADLPDDVKIVAEDLLNGFIQPNVIARIGANIFYQPDQPAMALLDFDSKGMPPDVRARMNEKGGFWNAVYSVLPALSDAARVVRRSTSAGLSRSDTGEELPGSDGEHVYLLVQDGADIERFLKALHARCWLAGLGWMMVGEAGQLLKRSLIDHTVGTPERLVFEGAPVLVPPLVQDIASRQPQTFDGELLLDTARLCPNLTIVEASQLGQLHAKAADALREEVEAKKTAFVAMHEKRLVARGLSEADAERISRQQCEGILLPSVELPFDSAALAGKTVADVLNDPVAFKDKTLADPLEGIEYGRCKAVVMLRNDGTPFIHSLAHGLSTSYELKYDATAMRAVLERAPDQTVLTRFIQLTLRAVISVEEYAELERYVKARTKINFQTIKRELKEARKAEAAHKAEEALLRRRLERDDPRPELRVPLMNAPWLPVMAALDEVLSQPAPEPPTRDVDGYLAAVRMRRLANMHGLDAANANEGVAKDDRLPAPEQYLLTRLDKMQTAELIERHIDYVTLTGRSVHLPTNFVEHYLQRAGDALPLVATVGIAPVVLPDGQVLAQEYGLDRKRGIIWRVPKEIIALIPRREECTPAKCAEALRFLIEEWLCDVEADFVGKCTAISAALTIIKRMQLDNRPTFSVTAGKAGGGKTTLLKMIIIAVTGLNVAAAAWSENVEERRKSLMSYLLEGVAYIIWDNIKNGSQISCPHIERACTTDVYSDRILGVNATASPSASAIQFFTGNNIELRGDLKTRDLNLRLQINQPDPENRKFKHPYPVEWTKEHRAKILRALYTILLGNPQLTKPLDAPSKTRFKTWWRLVGSAVEHAAKCATDAKLIESACEIDFQNLFLEQRQEEEGTMSKIEALTLMKKKWQGEFTAAQVAGWIAGGMDTEADELRDFLIPNAAPYLRVTAVTVGRRLMPLVDDMIKAAAHTLALRRRYDRTKTIFYWVETKDL